MLSVFGWQTERRDWTSSVLLFLTTSSLRKVCNYLVEPGRWGRGSPNALGPKSPAASFHTMICTYLHCLLLSLQTHRATR